MWSLIATTTILFVAGFTCQPVEISTPATDLLPPEVDDGPTLATDLVPPPLPEKEHKKNVTLFLINIFAVKNSTADETNDVLHDDVIKEVPDETAEPLAMFLLVVEEDDEDHPVNLDEVAKDLEIEGFAVDKVVKDGETRLIKVDLSSVDQSSEEVDEDLEKAITTTTEQSDIEDTGKLMKIRRKRTLCLKCKLDELKFKKYGGGCGGGCGGGGGGGGYYQPAPQPSYQPVQVIPVYIPGGGGGGGGHHGGGGYYQPRPQPPPPPQYHVQPSPCNTCGGGGGHGGGNAYAQASAQASAQSYGGY